MSEISIRGLLIPRVDGFVDTGDFKVLGTSYASLENLNGTKVTLSEHGIDKMRHDQDFADFLERTAEIVDELDGYRGPREVRDLEAVEVMQWGAPFHPYRGDEGHRPSSLYKPDALTDVIIKASDYESPSAYPLQFYAGNWIHRKLKYAMQKNLQAPPNFALFESPSGHKTVVSQFVDGEILYKVLMEGCDGDQDEARRLATALECDIVTLLRDRLGTLGVRLANDVIDASDGNILVSDDDIMSAKKLDDVVFTIIDQPHPNLRSIALFKTMMKLDKRNRLPHRLPRAHRN